MFKLWILIIGNDGCELATVNIPLGNVGFMFTRPKFHQLIDDKFSSLSPTSLRGLSVLNINVMTVRKALCFHLLGLL